MKRRTPRWLPVVVAIAIVAPGRQAMPAAGPVFSDTGLDAAGYGAAQGYPARRGGGVLPQVFMIGNYSHFDTLWPSHAVAKAPVPSQMRRAPNEITLRYYYQGVG